MSVAKVPTVFKLLASISVFIVALLAFIRWLFIEPTMSFTVPSPDGAAAIVKTYTDEPFVDITLVQRGIFGRSYSLGSFPSPTEFNSDGLIVGWEGNQQITIAWPRGEKPVNGPSQVGNIKVRYESYDRDLSSAPAEMFIDSELQKLSITFRQEIKDYGNARYKPWGRRIPEIDCILDVSGIDRNLSEQVDAQIVGEGIGRSTDAEAGRVFSGVHFKVAVKALDRGIYPGRTLTQAQLGDIFSQDHPIVAPGQDDGALHYHGYMGGAPARLISTVAGGKFELLVARGFGHQISRYRIDMPANDKILQQFNECSAQTNIYPGSFIVTR
jgi:hypothetical protein